MSIRPPAAGTAGAYVTVVAHGATAGTARPAGATRVFWLGSVAPTNAVQYDRWINSGVTPYTESIYNGTTWTSLGGGGTAATTTFTPTGGIAATDVQAALAELDTEKATLASPTFTGTPAAPTAAAGTSTTQVATTAFVAAAIVAPLSTKTANYTLTPSDSVVPFNGTSLTATLPSAVTAGASAKTYIVKNLNASALTLASTAGTIDGATTRSIAQNEAISVVSDGTNWLVV